MNIKLESKRYSEKELLNEIKVLKAQITDLDKAEKSADAAQDGVSEETLDLLLEAINSPDPLTLEEQRIEAHRKKRLLLGWQRKKAAIAARLDALRLRMEAIHRSAIENSAASKGDEKADTIYPEKKVLQYLKGQDPKFEVDDQWTTKSERTPYQDEELDVEESIPAIGKTIDLLSSVIQMGSISTLDSAPTIPSGIATVQDWEALSTACAHADDGYTLLEKVLDMMNRSGYMAERLDVANAAMDEYASKGDTTSCAMMLKLMKDLHICPDQYTSHNRVKVHVRAGDITKAIAILHQLEENTPAEMMTYSIVLEALLHHPDMEMRTQIWPVFRQMRLTAHPVPDSLLFAKIIRACALGIPQPEHHLWNPVSKQYAHGQDKVKTTILKKPLPDTERALDYFREMTIHYGMRPTADVYNAIILACARRRDMYDKALHFLQGMISMEQARLEHTDASAEEQTMSYTPNRETFNAILTGCARNGDLFRARWILAEMLRTTIALWRESVQQGETMTERTLETRPNSETLALVFFTYASYRVPAKKHLTQQSKGPKSAEEHTDRRSDDLRANRTSLLADNGANEETNENVETTQGRTTSEDTFSRNVPQTAAAVVREADGLWEQFGYQNDDLEASPSGLLCDICPNARLVCAYLAVLCAHTKRAQRFDRIEALLFGSKDEQSALEKWDITLNASICAVALKALAKESKRDRADALTSRIWEAWHKAHSPESLDDPVQISQCWAAMITNLAK